MVLSSSSSTAYKWYKDGVLIPGATGIDYIATEVGSYTVVVTETLCSSTASDPVTVTSGAPTIAIATTASTCFNSSVPQPISLTYSGTTFDPKTYRIVSRHCFSGQRHYIFAVK